MTYDRDFLQLCDRCKRLEPSPDIRKYGICWLCHLITQLETISNSEYAKTLFAGEFKFSSIAAYAAIEIKKLRDRVPQVPITHDCRPCIQPAPKQDHEKDIQDILRRLNILEQLALESMAK
jgi:hypothetical protein